MSGSSSGSSRFCRTTFGVHYDKDLLNAPGAMMKEGLPDMEARYEGSEVRPGWERNTSVVVGDLFDHHDNPLDLCGRGALKRAVRAWNEFGLDPVIGIELECFAFTHNENGRIIPYPTPGAVVYGTGAFADPLRFTEAIWDKACELGFKLEMLTAEYDAPQFEFTLGCDSAVNAVDDIFLFRLMAREIALEFGVLLSFLPKPMAAAGGSGMHVNLSFRTDDGTNALGDRNGTEPEEINDLAKGCLAGFMRHHKGLAGLVAPTANSYARLQPASLSGYWQNWGGDHRGVTARVSSETGAKARLEHRMADCSANPYIAVAAVLQAARLGVSGSYKLQPAETGDCFDKVDAKSGVAPNLAKAMDDLERDTELANAVGRGLVDNLLFMKRKEFQKTRDLEGEELRDFYIHFI